MQLAFTDDVKSPQALGKRGILIHFDGINLSKKIISTGNLPYKNDSTLYKHVKSAFIIGCCKDCAAYA